MAEAIAIPAAAMQFADIGARLLFSIFQLYGKVKDAPSHIAALSSEIEQLIILVKELQSDCLDSETTTTVVRALLDQCTALCERLQLILDKILAKSGDSTIRKTWKAVVAMKNEDEIIWICSQLERNKSTLSVWSSGKCHARLKDIERNLEAIGRFIPLITQHVSSIGPSMGEQINEFIPSLVASLQPHFQNLDARFSMLVASTLPLQVQQQRYMCLVRLSLGLNQITHPDIFSNHS